ncbi:MAG: hypothetical protein KDI90_06585 [Alphaproteobacteria bacterium]|nr:hypothetical protein [Alphaproteobacteria bacterium]MCB9974981.1 hypothetical protein [Rhodospirillales bacterium]
MRLRLIGVFLVVGVVLVFAGSGYLYPATWNYRITIEVETPEGLKAGSAVRQVKAFRPMALNPDVPNIKYLVLGEAVVVDLGERGVLFSIIRPRSYEEFFNAFPFNGTDQHKKLEFYNNIKLGEKAELKSTLPRLVMFRDLHEPISVVGVDVDNMGEVFGQGVNLKSITIEKTNDPVTYGDVRKKLTWLSDYYDKRLDSSRVGWLDSSNPTANSLSAGAFSPREER